MTGQQHQQGLETQMRLEPLVCFLFLYIQLTIIYKWTTYGTAGMAATTKTGPRMATTTPLPRRVFILFFFHLILLY